MVQIWGSPRGSRTSCFRQATSNLTQKGVIKFMKIQRSPEEKIKLIQKYVQSGLSQTEFCKKNNLALTSFNHWLLKKKTISKSIKQKLNFVPLSVDDEFQENPKIKTPVLEKITLKTLSGIALELPISVSTSWLSSLLKELV